ncbi:MAG: glycosyltransferase family 1 protein [Verrucomicrobia bacterium]|nr:MAG: glycosyltransferase family 1 protein [Verrucomicrobiota bacterium]
MSQRLKIAGYVYPSDLIEPTGVGMLTLHMNLALARNPDVEFKLLTSASELTGNGRLPDSHPLRSIPAIGLPMSRQMREGCWLAFNRPYIDRELPDDCWIYNSLETYTPTRRCRRIVTVHHIEPAKPERSFRQRLAHLRLQKAIRTADVLLAQSNFTAHEIANLYRVPVERISVVGSGVDESLLTERLTPKPSPYTPYVISVGAFQLRKGTDYLFAMARELQRRGSPLRIVCPFGLRGLPPFTEEVKSLPNVVALDYVSRGELLDLIRGAVCMVIPSRLEGFGLTAIESMALGTPVVASNNSALPETLGAAGILVEPTDARALADATENIFADAQHRSRLVSIGTVRARNFTWQKCMERLIQATMNRTPAVAPSRNHSQKP